MEDLARYGRSHGASQAEPMEAAHRLPRTGIKVAFGSQAAASRRRPLPQVNHWDADRCGKASSCNGLAP